MQKRSAEKHFFRDLKNDNSILIIYLVFDTNQTISNWENFPNWNINVLPV